VPKTGVKHVIVTEVADLLPPLKRLLINSVIKYVKKMVPAYHLPRPSSSTMCWQGHGQPVAEASPASSDVAVLQYTGGTTGVAKGAMLTHRNLVANMLQCKALMGSNLNEGCEILITPLPLYHIYAFTFHCMAMMLIGNHNILISNPRDCRRWSRNCRSGSSAVSSASTPCSWPCATTKASASWTSRR
jgi:long-chain acyl-CoA synthetase